MSPSSISRLSPRRPTNVDEINGAIERAAHQELKGILDYTRDPNVSSDFNHDPHSSNFAMDQTKVMDGNFVRVLAGMTMNGASRTACAILPSPWESSSRE